MATSFAKTLDKLTYDASLVSGVLASTCHYGVGFSVTEKALYDALVELQQCIQDYKETHR